MLEKNAPITIRQLSKTTPEIKQARELFLRYFTDLYNDKSPQTLQMTVPKNEYLAAIFDKTEKELTNDANLLAFFAYINNQIVGFTFFGPLEDKRIILVRSLPIDLAYKNQELAIRNALICQVKISFPNAEHIIVMVRKANAVHNDLCLQGGFRLDTRIFSASELIRTTYDQQCYNAYILNV